MDKQQAAEKYADDNATGVTGKMKAKMDFGAGWEAREAQFPTDAVAFADWCDNRGYARYVDGRWHTTGDTKPKWFTTAELYKLFKYKNE